MHSRRGRDVSEWWKQAWSVCCPGALQADETSSRRRGQNIWVPRMVATQLFPITSLPRSLLWSVFFKDFNWRPVETDNKDELKRNMLPDWTVDFVWGPRMPCWNIYPSGWLWFYGTLQSIRSWYGRSLLCKWARLLCRLNAKSMSVSRNSIGPLCVYLQVICWVLARLVFSNLF